MSSKIIPFDRLPEWRAGIRPYTVVVTNGCFDLLHAGHVQFLQSARNLGEVLLVGINDDASVQKLKGLNRPIYPEADRLEVIAALECVDAVCLFHGIEATEFLKAAQPAIWTKGGDYSLNDLNQHEKTAVLSGGGSIAVLGLLVGYSTTGTIKRIALAPPIQTPAPGHHGG